MLPPPTAVAAADMVVEAVAVAVAADTVVEAVVVEAAAVGTLAVAAVDTPADTSAVDPLQQHTSVLDTSRLDMDPAHTSRLAIGPMYTSQVDTAAISGTAVGGITALARVGYGRNITASTCGSAIKALQSCRRTGTATASHKPIHHLPRIPRRG
jgi:hypothetical protein